MNDTVFAIIICLMVSAIWYYLCKEKIAPRMSSEQDMTLTIFLIGLAAITMALVCLIIIMVIFREVVVG